MKIFLLQKGIYFTLIFCTFFTKINAQTYCTAAGNCSGFDEIINVTLSTLNKSTPICSNYSDFTSSGQADLFVGFGSTLTVTRKTPGGANIFGAVWIDWDKDGVFEDLPTMEKVATFSGPGNYSQLITPPAGAAIGLTRMRVRLEGTTPVVSACGVEGYEVEDYAINVKSGTPPRAPAAYCDARGLADPTCSIEFNNWISAITLNGKVNSSNCGLVNGYSDYLAFQFPVVRGTTYMAAINEAPASGAAFFIAEMWIDWNQDKDFDDPSEFIPCPNAGIGVFNANIVVPMDAAFGNTRMRLRARRADNAIEMRNPCGPTAMGEVEDYTIVVAAPAAGAYCAGSGDQGCVEAGANFITNVNVSTLNNSSTCDKENNGDGYSDFTNLSTLMVIGQPYTLNFTTGPTSDPADAGAVWVDWNGDGIFNPAPDAEALTVVGNPSNGTYMVPNFSPPSGSKLGDTRMRVRLRWNGSAPETTDPCGDTQYGEVEDYSVRISNGALSIKLINFDANIINNKNPQLKWSAEEDAELLGYEVQSSNDGASWKKEAFVDKDLSRNTNSYKFTSNQVINGIAYFRLRLVNSDGSFTYSEIRVLKNKFASPQLIISPNPANIFTNIKLTSLNKTTGSLQVYNASGAMVLSNNIDLKEGENIVRLPFKNTWKNGMYVVKVISENNNYVGRFMIAN